MKPIIISVILAVALIISGIIISQGGAPATGSSAEGSNVSVVGGKQIVEISAKGGYAPKVSVAKADTPTILRVTTRGTFDCSSILVIPSLNYSVRLPPTGEKDIEIPPQRAGSILRASCGMGMYNFQIQFN